MRWTWPRRDVDAGDRVPVRPLEVIEPAFGPDMAPVRYIEILEAA